MSQAFPFSGMGHHTMAMKAEGSLPSTPNSMAEPTRKRQRMRPVLACTECKRRKIRCNRTCPCEPCIKRGDEALCQWDPQVEPERTSYALDEDLQSLRQRLEHLEATLQNRKTLEACCPPSCACHDRANEHSLGSPGVAGEDLSRLIDERLGRFASGSVIAVQSAGAGCCSRRGTTDTSAEKQAQAAMRSASTIQVEIQPHCLTDSVDPPRLSALFGKDSIFATIDKALPDKAACDALLQCYMANFHWIHHVLHAPSFEREYDTFWAMRHTGQIRSVDPAWLALLAITLAHGQRCLSKAALPQALQQIAISDLEEYADVLYECAQIAMKAANWTKVPQLRILQTILLIVPYLDPSNEGQSAIIWIGAGVKIAHLLSLHHASRDPAFVPRSDLALPSNSSRFSSQLCQRLWMCLETADRQASLGARLPFSIAASGNGTLGHLWNCDDTDLESMKASQQHPADAITDITYEILKYRLVCHQQEFRSVCLAEESHQIGEVERLDRGLRALLEDMKDPALPPGGSPYGSKIDTAIRICTLIAYETLLDRFLVGRICMLRCAVWHRILRLHRSSMERGYTYQLFASSTQACLEAALELLSCNQRFRRHCSRPDFYFTLPCIDAVLVVFIDIFWKLDHGHPTTAIERNKKDLGDAGATFSDAMASFNPQVEKIGSLGTALLPKLLNEEKVRQQMSPQTREPITEVFKRIAYALCSSSPADEPPSASPTGFAAQGEVAFPTQLGDAWMGSTNGFQTLTGVFSDFDFTFGDTALFGINPTQGAAETLADLWGPTTFV